MESHRHQSAASLAPLVIARERIIRTAEAQARVEDVDAGAWVEQGTSDVEMGHRLIFVVFLDRDECFWHLNWKIKGKQNKMSAYTSTMSIDRHSQVDSSSHTFQSKKNFKLNRDH